MRTNPAHYDIKSKSSRKGFSLVEVLVGTAIAGILFLAFFAMMGTGFKIIRSSRENLRATQILLNRVEGLRLFTYEQLIYSNNLAPATFTEAYDPIGTNSGITYNGSWAVSTPTMNPTATYSSSNVKQITVNVAWTSGNKTYTRSMSTYVSRYGAQNYIWSN